MLETTASRYRYALERSLRNFPADKLPPAGQVAARFMLKAITYAGTRYYNSASRQHAQQTDLERLVLEDLTRRVAGDGARYLLEMSFDCLDPDDAELDALPVKAQLPRRAAAIADLIQAKTLWMPIDAARRCAPPLLSDLDDYCPY
ncbi:hypothetical protein [Methylibium petroleiphilum]|uniref:Uncharacterized protein n=1 Tax=Methylibium petroleiphilum (strain ATCC BAA-1232 / LMG 22953 / PM1) TaxID=420662 RepID=A2SN42_METPP|nr:hypothetical protein [Methylibium petroleiphilum]ABM96981.1 hypothetical protein Mpe_B0206 [Methylibium petroleiphilum PM1]